MKIGYFPDENVKNNVSFFLEEHTRATPDKTIFYWAVPDTSGTSLVHQRISYNTFTLLASRIASGFQQMGITQGDRVILFLPMSVPMYLALSALQRIGAIPVFLDSFTRHIHMSTAIQQVQPKAIISFEKAFELLSDLSHLVPLKISVGPTTKVYTASIEALQQTASSAPIVPVKQEDTALITFTTGSSGIPKGADRSHRFLAAQHYALNNTIPYQKDAVDLPIFPVFSLNNVASGISTVLPAIDITKPQLTDSHILLQQMEACKVNCATLSPAVFANLANYCRKNKMQLAHLKRVVTGGAPISRRILTNFREIATNTDIVVLYGSTEVEPISKITYEELLSTKATEARAHDWLDEGVNVGRLVKGLRYKLIKLTKHSIKIHAKTDWKKLAIKDGDVGELLVSGEHVCQKYYNNQQAFKRAKIVDVDGTIWHRTGDLIRFDQSGNFWIVGRVHNAIMRNGRYVYPVRAEEILKSFPFVRQAAYLGIADPSLGEKAVVVIELSEKERLPKNQTAYKATVRQAFSQINLPVDELFFVDAIPMDPRHHSKVAYNQLRKLLLEKTHI